MTATKRFFPVAALLCAVAALSVGCLSRPPLQKQFFALRPPAETVTQGYVLAALGPLTVDPLCSGRPLVYRRGANEFESDPYAEWLLDPREMLEEVIGGLLRSERVETWVPPKSVECHVAEFGGDFRDGNASALVRLNWATGAGPQRVTRSIEMREPLRERTAAEVVAGLDRALKAAVTALLADLRSRVAAPPP